MSQTDRQRLERLLATRVPVISVRTFEEGYVLDLVRQVTADAGWDLQVSADLMITAPPTETELSTLRGMRTVGGPA